MRPTALAPRDLPRLAFFARRSEQFVPSGPAQHEAHPRRQGLREPHPPGEAAIPNLHHAASPHRDALREEYPFLAALVARPRSPTRPPTHRSNGRWAAHAKHKDADPLPPRHEDRAHGWADNRLDTCGEGADQTVIEVRVEEDAQRCEKECQAVTQRRCHRRRRLHSQIGSGIIDHNKTSRIGIESAIRSYRRRFCFVSHPSNSGMTHVYRTTAKLLPQRVLTLSSGTAV